MDSKRLKFYRLSFWQSNPLSFKIKVRKKWKNFTFFSSTDRLISRLFRFFLLTKNIFFRQRHMTQKKGLKMFKNFHIAQLPFFLPNFNHWTLTLKELFFPLDFRYVILIRNWGCVSLKRKLKNLINIQTKVISRKL